MNRYDHIEVVEKNDIDEITVVEKFNPFHDGRGRFSSSNGFASYSANPNTKAGAMAISRSAAAGHGNTVNVHRQSYGENIRQNANWIGRGKQQSPRQQANATLRSRIEPKSGLRGASAAGARWQSQNQSQGRTTQAPKQKPTAAKPAAQKPTPQAKPAAQKPTQQQATKPKGKNLAQDVSGVTVTSGNKLAIQPRNSQGHTVKATKVANDNYQGRVAGKDITKNFDTHNGKQYNAIDNVAVAQGWNKAPTVTNDLATFQAAAQKSGRVMFRSVNADLTIGDAKQVSQKTMTDGNMSLGGTGGKMYGGGMYLVDSKLSQAANGRVNAHNLSAASNHSFAYANTQMMATVHPDAKISTSKQSYQMQREFNNLSLADRSRFGRDVGAYIASKGYDGAKWHTDDDPTAYTTIYNKSALIFYGGVSTAR